MRKLVDGGEWRNLVGDNLGRLRRVREMQINHVPFVCTTVFLQRATSDTNSKMTSEAKTGNIVGDYRNTCTGQQQNLFLVRSDNLFQ